MFVVIAFAGTMPVAPRKRRVSRNSRMFSSFALVFVAPRMGRVSRNLAVGRHDRIAFGRAPYGACE